MFSAVLVESLDLYRVEFVTSRYLSFADHVARRDPVTYAHAARRHGRSAGLDPVRGPRPPGSADIAAAMTPAG